MLKILTLNLNYYVEKHGPWPRRRELICQAIESAQPDILAFQAVRQKPQAYDGQNQAAQLAALFPELQHIFFRPALETPGGGHKGSAIVSRLPMAAQDALELSLKPGLEDSDRRVVLHARFDLPGHTLHLFNGHFSWVPQQSVNNIQETLDYMAQFDGPALLVGDLNTPDDSDLLERLRAAGLTDAWARLRPGEAGRTFESSEPSIRIDYAWANTGLQPRLHSIEIIANQRTANGIGASDHFGLLIELDLPAEIA